MNQMTIKYENRAATLEDKIGREVWYKNMEGTIQGIAVGNDGQMCYVVEVNRTVFDNFEWKTALFPIDKVKNYDSETLAAKATSYYHGAEYFDCGVGLDPSVKCGKCPIRICGMTPLEFYEVRTCYAASVLDKLYNNKEEITSMFKDMDERTQSCKEKENRKW